MMIKIPLGTGINGGKVFIYSPPNPHVSTTGISGTGKSMFLRSCENAFAEAGAAVVIVNCAGSHDVGENERLPVGYKDRYVLHNMQSDGIPVSMWVPNTDPDTAARYLISALNDSMRLGSKQKALLYDGLKRAYELQVPGDDDEMAFLLSTLEKPEGKPNEISTKLRLSYGFLRLSPQYEIFKPGRILDLKFESDFSSVKAAVNLFLYLLCVQKKTILPDTELVLVLDEYQHLDLEHQEAPIPLLLKEGRKQGISLLLATQSTRSFSRQEKACINQAATQVYFRQMPEDAREVARFWANSSKEQKKLEQDLASLRVGQAIVSGSLADASGRELPRLVHISNYMPCLPSARVVAFTPSRKSKHEHTHPATADAVSSRVHVVGRVEFEVPDSNDGEEQLIHEERR